MKVNEIIISNSVSVNLDITKITRSDWDRVELIAPPFHKKESADYMQSLKEQSKGLGVIFGDSGICQCLCGALCQSCACHCGSDCLKCVCHSCYCHCQVCTCKGNCTEPVSVLEPFYYETAPEIIINF